jgi:hypothetical protein
MSINLDPTLDVIAVRESFKHWLINRFAKTDYARNQDPLVQRSDNIRCLNDSGTGCMVGNPDNIYQAILSPGVRGKDADKCNSVNCRAWTPTTILDRMQVANAQLPSRLILIDWLTRGQRIAALQMLQISVVSTNTQDDMNGYKLMSLRNALVEALDLPDPPTAKHIPLYSRSSKGKVRFMKSNLTNYTMTMTPSGDERMSRINANPHTMSGDRSGFTQMTGIIGEFTFTFNLAMCQRVNVGGAFI